MVTEVIARWKALGIDRDVDACDCCGRTGLKKTVIMAVLDADPNVTETYRFGCQCAAKHTGLPAARIRQAAEKANDERIQAWMQDTGKAMGEQLKALPIPAPVKLDGDDRRSRWGDQVSGVAVGCFGKFDAERLACYRSAYLHHAFIGLFKTVTVPTWVDEAIPPSSVQWNVGRIAVGYAIK